MAIESLALGISSIASVIGGAVSYTFEHAWDIFTIVLVNWKEVISLFFLVSSFMYSSMNGVPLEIGLIHVVLDGITTYQYDLDMSFIPLIGGVINEVLNGMGLKTLTPSGKYALPYYTTKNPDILREYDEIRTYLAVESETPGKDGGILNKTGFWIFFSVHVGLILFVMWKLINMSWGWYRATGVM